MKKFALAICWLLLMSGIVRSDVDDRRFCWEIVGCRGSNYCANYIKLIDGCSHVVCRDGSGIECDEN